MSNPGEVVIEPRTQWWLIDWGELWAFRDLVWFVVKRDFNIRFRQTVLGPLWYVIQPLFTTLVFTIVFGQLAGISTDGLPKVLFYLTSLLGWNYFSRVFGDVSGTLVANSTMYSKIYFPRLVMPLSKVFNSLFTFLIQLVTLVGFMIYYACCTGQADSFAPNWVALLSLPLVLLLTSMLAMGAGLLVASVSTRYRDLLVLVPFCTQLLMYFSAVVLPLSVVPEQWQWVANLNPMVPVVEWFRFAFLGTGTLTVTGGIGAVVTALVLLFAGLMSFQRSVRTFVDTV